MKTVFGKIDRGITLFIDSLASVSLIALTLVIVSLVLCRYVFRISVSGLSELPTYLLYFNIWMAAILNAQSKNGHISLDFIGMIVKNKTFKQIAEAALLLVAVVTLCFFTYCAYNEVVGSMARGNITSGMKMPVWYIYAFVLFSSTLMTLYNLRRLCLAVKEVVNT